jgi:hypothetical protein
MGQFNWVPDSLAPVWWGGFTGQYFTVQICNTRFPYLIYQEAGIQPRAFKYYRASNNFRCNLHHSCVFYVSGLTKPALFFCYFHIVNIISRVFFYLYYSLAVLHFLTTLHITHFQHFYHYHRSNEQINWHWRPFWIPCLRADSRGTTALSGIIG